MSLVYDGVGNITNWTYRSGQKQGLYAGSNSLSPNPTMAYSFSYDTQNRLKSANLTQNTSTTVFAMGGSDGGKIGYDDNGNILSLNRSLNGTLVDNLSYSYGTNSNRLFRVEDASGNASLFNNLNSGSDDYSYDATGNLIRDANKDLITISYNHLNLPQSVVTASGTVSYTYTASGQKLKASFPGSPAKTYDYAGGLVYEGGKLEFIPTAEGRILPPGRAINPASGTSVVANRYYRYEYQLKDHLGNLRVACRCPEITTAVTGSQLPGPGDTYPLMTVQEEQYDPWGLSLTSLSSQTVVNGSRFKYNSKEEQQGLGWIDYGARMYDPTIGRWIAVDSLAEKWNSISPYTFVLNNSLKVVELDGKDIIILAQSSNSKQPYIRYKDGQLYNLNGSVYKGSDQFARNTQRALANIGKIDDSFVRKVLTTLQDSKNIHLIRPDTYPHTDSDIPFKAENGEKTGSIIGIGGEQNSKIKATPETTLGHELRHSYDYEIGNMKGELNIQSTAEDPSEIRAVNFENRIRHKSNLPLRTTYSGVEIDKNKLDNPKEPPKN